MTSIKKNKNKTNKTNERDEKENESEKEVEMMEEDRESRPSRRNSLSSISVSSVQDDRASTSGYSLRKKRKALEFEVETHSASQTTSLEDIRKERKELERYLFSDNNKISKPAIKFILEKWLTLETKLQDQVLEIERLKAIKQTVDTPALSYSRVVRTPGRIAPSSVTPEKKKENFEVLLIKPNDEEADKRNNNELKNDIIKKLKNVEHKLKVKNMRQLKKKGMVLEVQSDKDVEMINGCDLSSIGLRIERPKKMNPSIVIYDVEKEHKVEDLKDNFINKNFNTDFENDLKDLIENVNFVHSFKTKDGNRLNWIVQIPGSRYWDLLDKGRVYMLWRAYKIKEYFNTVRCFKCHGFGHIAKVCSVTDQICDLCGSKEHLREKCNSKDDPRCINCIRSKRKEVKHSVRSRECPEYLKYLEIYKSKIKWR